MNVECDNMRVTVSVTACIAQ